MISLVLTTVVMLCMGSFGRAFIGSPLSLRPYHAESVGCSLSMSSSDLGTRRDLVKQGSVLAAGVFTSAIIPTVTTAAASSKPEVYTTPGGVKFIVLKEGTGPLARDGDYLVVEFTGFLPDGQVFDASNSPGRKPIAFKLGSRQVIKGWEEVLRMMNAGAEVQMVVPAKLAFGDKGICIESGDCLVKPGMDVTNPIHAWAFELAKTWMRQGTAYHDAGLQASKAPRTDLFRDPEVADGVVLRYVLLKTSGGVGDGGVGKESDESGSDS